MNDEAQQRPGEDQAPLEKTFIEGSGAQPTPHSLDSGVHIDAGRVAGASNPYAPRQSHTAVSLPTGDQPERLGSGTVAGILGAGGMAKIYKIWNEKLEVHRAVKIMLPSHGQELLERFETEGKITAKLHHPNIVEIYMVGDYNGLPYLEMEFIDGKPLDALIGRHGRLPAAVSSAIGIFIARALAYAHSQDFLLYHTTYKGVIHRDLKPANIMVSDRGIVKLMDFGIARPTETSLHTVDGNIVGTMQYLSPEQLDAKDIDCRTDIYSFGAILYEMLSGSKTFPQGSITNLLKMKSMNEYQSLGEFPFAVASALAKISQKCLERDKEARFENAEALLEALQKAHSQLSSEPPEKVIVKFLADPEQFEGAQARGIGRFFSPKIIVALAAVVALGVAGALLFVTRPHAPETAVRVVPEPPAAKPAAPPPPAAQAVPEARTQQPAQKTPASRAPRPEPTPSAGQQAAVRPAPVRRSAASPLEALKTRYDSDDLLAVARKALDKGENDDAIAALNAVPESHPEGIRRMLYLLEAYIEAGKQSDARRLAATTTLDDAQFDLLRGRIEEKSWNYDKALSYYQSALTKPSTARDVGLVRSDALYYTALINDRAYRQSPTPETRLQALNSWNVVKRTYGRNPNHPRFKMANSKLATVN